MSDFPHVLPEFKPFKLVIKTFLKLFCIILTFYKRVDNTMSVFAYNFSNYCLHFVFVLQPHRRAGKGVRYESGVTPPFVAVVPVPLINCFRKIPDIYSFPVCVFQYHIMYFSNMVPIKSNNVLLLSDKLS